MPDLSRSNSVENWRTRTYTLGALGGALFGFLAAYLYSRAAGEDADRMGGKPRSLGTGEIIGIGLAILALIRQISELGTPQKKR